MYKITVENENGETRVIENVLDYNVIDLDLCQSIAADKKTELSDEEINEICNRCSKCEQLPDMEDLRWIIQNVINDRE